MDTEEQTQEVEHDATHWNDELVIAIREAIYAAQMRKPKDRSATARACAIVITDLEKVFAYAKTYIVEGIELE